MAIIANSAALDKTTNEGFFNPRVEVPVANQH